MRVTPCVLIVDDDRFFLEFYRAEFSQHNFQVEFAQDGEEGVAQAKKLIPDVILLDVILPKKDGFEVLSELKSDPATAKIPVIITSTLGNEADIKKLLDNGAIKNYNKITALPKDVAVFVESLVARKPGTTESVPAAPVAAPSETKLTQEQIKAVFQDGLTKIEGSLTKLFGGKVSLEDMNISMIPFSGIKDHIAEISKAAGTIYVYSKIKSKESGIAILAMKRDDTLTLIKLIEKGATGHELGLEMSDNVIEEFFNIILNSFLNELSKSAKGQMMPQPPSISNSRDMMGIIEKLRIPDNNPVIFMEESYMVEGLDMGISLYTTFGEGIFNQ